MTRVRHIAGSLTARVVMGYVLIAAVFAAAWLWSLYGPMTEAALRQQQRNLTAVAQAAALVTAESSSAPGQIADQLVARTDLRLTIVGSDGAVIADSNFEPAQMENHGDRPEIATALQGDVGVARRLSRTEGQEELYVAVPASIGGQRVALRVSQPITEIESIAARSRRWGLALLVVALGIAAAVAYRTALAAQAPIRDLTAAAQRMASGDLDAPMPAMTTDLEPLAASLDTLRAQVRSRIDELETERRTLQTTLDGLPDAVLLLDGRTIEYANEAASRLFTRPGIALRGSTLDASCLPAPLVAEIERRTTGSNMSSGELETDPLGRTLHLVVAPVASAVGTRSIVTVSDVTDRARLDKMRRDFVANASHELKTPTAGIRLLAESVEAARQDGDVEQAMVFASQIGSQTERLQRVVADLLDLSRLETAGRPEAVTNVRQAVDNALISHRSAAERKGLVLDVDTSRVRNLDVFAAADPTDVAIALDNLLDNAIAYTDAGSVRVTVKAGDAVVRIAISDTGPGIPPEHQPRVFERFYRVDSGRSRDAGGTGLGLALVKHVAERSAGSISLTSTPGQGSTFTLTLPRAS